MNDLVLLKKLDATVARFVWRFQMPPEFQPKSFMRAYWAIRHQTGKHAGYVPNFDLYTVSDMRSALRDIGGESWTDKLSDDEVELQFQRVIGNAVSSLEKDVGARS